MTSIINDRTAAKEPQQHRHAKNRVQFNLGSSARLQSRSNTAAGSSLIPNSLSVTGTPKQLRASGINAALSTGKNLISQGLLGEEAQNANVLPAKSALKQSSSASPPEILDSSGQKSHLFVPPVAPSSRPASANNAYEDLISSSITHLIPKPRLRAQALTRRNQSKVSYTYQAVIRPSSPSYMASTSASRNRSINNSSKAGGGGPTDKTRKTAKPPPTNSTGKTQTRTSIASNSSHSSNSSSLLRASNSSRTLGTKSRVSRKRGRKSRFRMSSSHHDFGHRSSTVSVVLKEKVLSLRTNFLRLIENNFLGKFY